MDRRYPQEGTIMKSPTRVAGGKKAAKKQKELYGEDVFEIIGRAGGVVGTRKKALVVIGSWQESLEAEAGK